VSNLTKRFGGLVAVNSLTFKLEEGELLGLIGPNGAGKTTLFNLISGFEKPTEGAIMFKGKRIDGLPPHEITKLGISRTFQIPQPFINMTVLQNLLIASMYGAGLSMERAQAEAKEILRSVGLADKESLLTKDLTMVELRKLELARALCNRPRLLLVDEAAAGLAPKDISKILDILKKIHENGVTIIMVEHVLSVIMKMAERVMVMHQGGKLAEGKPLEIIKTPEVIEAYLGTLYV
jgi:branched-chain amino acid transport system ATP-binding protein